MSSTVAVAVSPAPIIGDVISTSTTKMKPVQIQMHIRKFQKRLFKVLDSAPVQLFMLSLLMLSLFMADAWIAGNAPDSQNIALDGVLIIVLILFCLETILLSFCQHKYFLGFFFWMDILGTVSIIFDIKIIAETFMPSDGLAVRGSVLRATRAAKLGARYGRLMRLLKLMKFLKYLPCFTKVEEEEPTMSAVRRVSDQLSNVLSQRVAALVMIFVIVIPYLSYSVSDSSVNAWINSLKAISKQTSSTSDDLKRIITKANHFYIPKVLKLIDIRVTSPGRDEIFQSFKTRAVLKHSNIYLYESKYSAIGSTAKNYAVTLRLDMTYPNQQDSILSMVLIILVIIVLVGFSASFKVAVESLVVVPLEKMMTTLRTSATLMLKSMKAMEDKDDVKNKIPGEEDDDDLDQELETQMLEKLVEKLARIVKNVIPGGQDIIIDSNVDSSTASWLTSNYSQGAKKVVAETVKESFSVQSQRLQKLATMQTIVTPQVLNSWDFDILDYSNEQLIEILTYIFATRNVFDEFKVPVDVFRRFLAEIHSLYVNTNTYHNFKHGADVCHTCYRLIMIPGLHDIFSSLEVFSVLVAAVAHDVGHLGVNNLFLIKAKDKLALLHNDRSPLENMHCAVLYNVMSKAELNIFSTLTESQWRESRKIILAIILGTDMSHHFEQISKTQLFLEVHKEDTNGFCRGEKDVIECFADDSNRMFIMELILHCSDISNPYKPFAICARWADLVCEEFASQGDREKREGLEVSPMMDRDLIVLCNMQMGFIEFVVTPLINAFVNIFPPLHEMGTNLMLNYAAWGERRKGEIKLDEKIADKVGECGKLDDRIVKFQERQSFVNALKVLPLRSASASSESKSAKL